MARYDALEAHLRSLPGDTVRLTFDEINKLIAPHELPASAYVHPQQYLSSTKTQPIPAAWMRAGWKKSNHDFDQQYVELRRVVPLEAITLADDVGDDGLDNENRQFVNIKTRRGQADFRNRLRRAYGGTCAITGSTVTPLLEAAHIVPHALKTDYATSNGLLLRADIHTLFDLHLIAIDADGRVAVSRTLEGTEYAQYHGRCFVAFPVASDDQPSTDELKRHHDLFLAREDALYAN